MTNRRTVRHAVAFVLRKLEVMASILGVAGGAILATGSFPPLIGWGCFLLSNCAWIAFARVHQHQALAWQHIAFLLTSVVGLIRAL